MLSNISQEPYTVGVDIGSNSIGMVGLSTSGEILFAITRYFTDYLGSKKKPTSPAEARRTARLARRGRERTKRRTVKLSNILRRHGLLASEKEMNKDIYALRVEALDKPLPLNDIGLVILSLSRRRGYKKTESRNEFIAEDPAEKDGKVLTAIAELKETIKEKGFRTYGEYLNSLPKGAQKKNHYSHRDMVDHEFNMIWDAQATFYPHFMTDALKTKVYEALFFQRPLGDMSDKVGNCEVFWEEKRCHRAAWEACEARLLQDINNIRIKYSKDKSRSLTLSESIMVAGKCRNKPGEKAWDPKGVSFDSLLRILKQNDPKIPESAEINLDTATRKGKGIFGQFVDWILRDIFDDYDSRTTFYREVWNTTLTMGREPMMDYCLDYGIPSDQSEKMYNARYEMSLPDDYSSYSKKAWAELIGYLENGASLHQAKEEAFPFIALREKPVLDRLPPLTPHTGYHQVPDEVLVEIEWGNITNGVVARAVTEYRKMMNTVLSIFGKPESVVVEMARDAKLGLKKRKQIIDEQSKNAKEKSKIVAWLTSNKYPTHGGNITRYRLWTEQGGVLSSPGKPEVPATCPYTGKKISSKDAFTEGCRFDIEHIVPSSVPGSSSHRENLVLACKSANQFKNKNTPWQAWGESDQWKSICLRVEGEKIECEEKTKSGKKKYTYKGGYYLNGMSKDKIKLILSKKDPEDTYRPRSLHDTGYAACIVVRYTELLGVDVEMVSGAVVASLRRALDLESRVLNTGKSKREDNRNHALDAFILARMTPSCRNYLSKVINQPNWKASQEVKDKLAKTYTDELVASFKEAIDQTGVISVRSNHSVSGAIHKDTIYGNKDGKQSQRRSLDWLVDGSSYDARFPQISSPSIRNYISKYMEEEIAKAQVERGIQKHIDDYEARKESGDLKPREKKPSLSKSTLKKIINDIPPMPGCAKIKRVKCLANKAENVVVVPNGFKESGGNHCITFYLCEDGKVVPRCLSNHQANLLIVEAKRHRRAKRQQEQEAPVQRCIPMTSWPGLEGSSDVLTIHREDTLDIKIDLSKSVKAGRYVVISIMAPPTGKTCEIKIVPIDQYGLEEPKYHKLCKMNWTLEEMKNIQVVTEQSFWNAVKKNHNKKIMC